MLPTRMRWYAAAALGGILAAASAAGCAGSQAASVAWQLAGAASTVGGAYAGRALSPAPPPNGAAAPAVVPACVGTPADPCAGPPAPVVDDELSRARAHTLSAINGLRASLDREFLTADEKLDAFAEDGSVALARDHRPHGHLLAHSDGCRPCADVQSDTAWRAGDPLEDQIDAALSEMAGGPPGDPNRDNLLAASWRRVGIGIARPKGRLFLTLDFAP
jgi:hypothetical protein